MINSKYNILSIILKLILKLCQELLELNKFKNKNKNFMICSKVLCLENIKYMLLVFIKYILNKWSIKIILTPGHTSREFVQNAFFWGKNKLVMWYDSKR